MPLALFIAFVIAAPLATTVADGDPAAAARPRNVPLSSVEVVSYHSAALGTRARYDVYIPAGGATRDLPVLVLLHGLGGESRDWFLPEHGDLRRVLDQMIAEGALPPVVAVAPNGLGGYWTDHVSHAPGTAWGTFIGEAVEHATQRYGLSDRRAIVGVSMGGHGAMSQGLMHPERFVAIVSMAGALFAEPPTHRPIYKKVWGDPADVAWFRATAPVPLLRDWPATPTEATPRLLPPPIWLHCGRADTDRFLDWTLAADKLLTERDFDHVLTLSDGGHGWGTWRPMARAWLTWLAPKLR